jgi:phosphopantothenoylcysteine decarboxylase/phosphopantothenate--cysteine ligase
VFKARVFRTLRGPILSPAMKNRATKLLITAGPTHEPIDAVRFIGNRSSGRVGVALADRAAARGVDTTILLGPTPLEPSHTGVRLIRFQTTADLQAALARHVPECETLIMAAAVADYRPSPDAAAGLGGSATGKLRREKRNITIELEPTPDLLAGVSESVRASGGHQRLIGFALEPREGLLDVAKRKLERKGCDAIVANPLETMDADSIEAWLVWKDGRVDGTPGTILKTEFADWLLDRVLA